MSDYFIVIPAQVRTDSRLSLLARLLYGDIAALAKTSGECWASNTFFATEYQKDRSRIISAIKELTSSGYVRVEYRKPGNNGRVLIPCCENTTTSSENATGTCCENTTPPLQKHNGTRRENATHKNINEKEYLIFTDTQPAAAPKKKVFKPPTLSEVQEYCTERDNGIDPQTFLDFYEARGWMCGKVKMSDWRASVRLWERRSQDEIKKPEYHFVE